MQHVLSLFSRKPSGFTSQMLIGQQPNRMEVYQNDMMHPECVLKTLRSQDKQKDLWHSPGVRCKHLQSDVSQQLTKKLPVLLHIFQLRISICWLYNDLESFIL